MLSKGSTSICPQCGRTFVRSRYKQVFCSKSCSNSARDFSGTAQAVCEKCNTTFTYFKSRGAVRYCSRACYEASPHPRDIMKRFWKKVEKNGPVPTSNPSLGPCWLWTGGLQMSGYGRLRRYTSPGAGRRDLVHHVSYELHHGPVPDGLIVRHRCHNRACVNPDHLVAGTRQDNVDDMVAARRHVHGSRSWQTHLTEDDVREMRRLRAEGVTARALAERYGLQTVSIHAIISRRNWSHVE